MRRNNMENKEWGKAIRIFEALSGVDEELLARSEEGTAKVLPLWRYSKVIAACFCLIVAGGLTWGAFRVSFQSEKSTDQAMPRSMEEIAEEITADVTEDEMPRSMEEITADITDGAAQDDSGAGSSTGQYSMSGGSENNEGALLERDMQPETDDFPVQQAAVECVEEKSDDTRQRIEEKEAYATEGLGAYIPAVLPAGYAFEGAYRKQNPDTGEYDSINITWTKGMDSIFLTVEKAEASNIALTDLSKPETYNVHLYDIPYGETVPREYWEAFNNPVFGAADLSLELIEARMKAVQDLGDTGTPRGDFSVLYENDVLIRFNGDGTAQEIWEMFQSVGP